MTIEAAYSEIAAYLHHVSDFTTAALTAGFSIERLDEWWGPRGHRSPASHPVARAEVR